jgi:hypothetical protein
MNAGKAAFGVSPHPALSQGEREEDKGDREGLRVRTGTARAEGCQRVSLIGRAGRLLIGNGRRGLLLS